MQTTSGKAQIAYDVVGDARADGHDVLLMHAGVNDRRSWSHVVERLSPRHRCVSFDRRGFGETTYDLEDGWSETSDAAAVLNSAGVDSVVIVACSMGGAAALDFALDYPDLVKGLVLIGPAVRGAPYPEVTEEPNASLERDVEAADEAGDLDEVNRLETWMWLDGPAAQGRVKGAARDLFMEMNAHALRKPDPGEREDRASTWDRVDEITVPALVMVGTLDVQDVRAVDELLAQRLRDGDLVWLEGVAHVPHLEGHPETLDRIQRFVAETPTVG